MSGLQLFLTLCLLFGTHVACQEEKDVGSPLRLTPQIKSGNIEEAQQLALVTGLTPNITSYAGFLTVDEEYDSNLFFWFFPSQSDMENDPVTVWLQGGPGKTSLFGLFTENGPYELTTDGELKLREYSWNRESSVLYLDNPVGAGYSFANSVDCYSKNQTHLAENAVKALEQFFELFPNLKKNKFFLSGESYAGKYIPAIGNRIHQGPTTIENFEGILIGNGLIDPLHSFNYSRLYYQLGLVDDEGRKEMEDLENQIVAGILKGNYTEANIFGNDMLWQIFFSKNLGFTYAYNFLYSSEPNNTQYQNFVIRPEIRQAIHVGNSTWNDHSSEVESALTEDIMRSAVPNLIPIMENYRSLLFYGQLDLTVPYAPSVNFIQNLDWTGSETYKTAKRYIWKVDGETAGYGKDTNQFTEILIRNAGHIVPYDQPKWAFSMYNAFIHGESLTGK